MVEGPGCKVKGEIMRRRIVGKTIVSASRGGKVVDVDDSGSNKYHQLSGRQILEVRTLGKELFIFFAESLVCVRVHFLMDGSVRYGEFSEKNVKSAADVSLVLSFADDELCVLKSAVDLRSTEASIEHCDALDDLDICSPSFNIKRAQELVQKKHDELICDVIMDQSILPGVGNIIKNEGLFKSGINPNTVVRELPSHFVSCLLHRLRDFSSIFYICRKTNKSLKQHLCVYEKEKCSQCGNKVTVCKPGNLCRLTFYCSKCQTNSNKCLNVSLPKKNSLLGFLQFSKAVIQDENWECELCTFINKPIRQSCEICLTERTSNRKRKFSEEKLDSATVIKRRQTDSSLKVPSLGSKDGIKESDEKSVPLCSGHNKKCITKTVIHSAENKGRCFYSCSMPAKERCKFFMWADLHYPLCEHKKRTIRRRVLKQNANNGKEFFCCPLPKGEQCSFFGWVNSA